METEYLDEEQVIALLQQGPNRQEDVAHRHLVLTGGAAVRGHDLRLLDPQRDGLEGLA